jgi:hypothetical protein
MGAAQGGAVILCSDSTLAARRTVAAGELAALAHSLGEELQRYLPDVAALRLPQAKAKLSRHGGRCQRDGEHLEFHPLVPDQHRCGRCGRVYRGEEHYLWWIMGYQLWLAERALHGAVLGALSGETRCRETARHILVAAAEQYLHYPNRDNVLGPSRPFFSTYLESIWLLQLALALDFLEGSGAGDPWLGSLVRERLIEPSLQLIASYDEGLSNRQVWNNAALLAGGVLLGQEELQQRALYGESGLLVHLEHGLLRDGSWYEGENYHLFAHRGLWYLVTAAAALGAALPATLLDRFEEGFALPFLTALPDLTFPARRDSQYGVSLRQWRVAESCELGLARRPDERRLAAALQQLYSDRLPVGDPGRWRSTAEAERNLPGVRLTRSDLGWKTLLFALPRLPTLEEYIPTTVLLDAQGFAVVRRAAGSVYVALDYGHTGGGHGHPDRLNLWLVNGEQRVLEDFGTGSYVDPSLAWYRSTLAHNAPLLEGRSQPYLAGYLAAWWDDGERTWVAANFVPDPQCRLRRDLVVMEEYLIDVLKWDAGTTLGVDLPLHVQGSLAGSEFELEWEEVSLGKVHAARNGFAFVKGARRASPGGSVVLAAAGARAFVFPPEDHEWWRLLAPGPPAQPECWFFLLRCRGKGGAIVTVWDWSDAVAAARWERGVVRVKLGSGREDAHLAGELTWTVSRRDGPLVQVFNLRAGLEPVESLPVARSLGSRDPLLVPVLAREPSQVGELSEWAARPSSSILLYRLGREHYRRSEESWEEAGRPQAGLALCAAGGRLYLELTVSKKGLRLAGPPAESHLDNEPLEINADGVQLHLLGHGPDASLVHHVWVMALCEGGDVRIRDIHHEGPLPAVGGRWRMLSDGYQLLAWVELLALGSESASEGWLDVLINESTPERERRRGQLVLSGASGEWVYLRGARQDPERYLPIRIVGDGG